MSETDRKRAYSEITEMVKSSLERFSQEFPDRIEDDRHHEAIGWSQRGLRRVFQILDGYDLTSVKQTTDEAPVKGKANG